MTGTRPHPGTAARYRGSRNRPGCRCPECTRAHRKDCAARELAHLRGEEVRMAKEPVLEHIRALQADGWSLSQIARAAGKSQPTLSTIVNGPYQMVNRATGRAILAVRGPKTDPCGMTSSVGSVRRLRALYALGHEQVRVAEACGLHRDAVADLVHGRTKRVTERTAVAIRGAYEVLSMEIGASDRNRAVAREAGWVPPLAWDDAKIDNPNCRPVGKKCPAGGSLVDDAAVIRALEGEKVQLRGPDRVAAVERGIRRGMTHGHVAETLSMDEDTVKRYWERAKEYARARGETWPGKHIWNVAA